MKNKNNFESAVKIGKPIRCGVPVSADDCFELTVTIAPKTQGMLLIEKIDEESAIEVSSEVIFSYPAQVVIADREYYPKTTVFKYDGKQVDIKEKVFEHGDGVVFKYKNNKNMFFFIICGSTKTLKHLTKQQHGYLQKN